MLKHLLLTHEHHHFLPAFGGGPELELRAPPGGMRGGKRRARQFAFVGLEGTGGVMVIDVTEPATPRFVSYTNELDFPSDPD